MVVVIYGGVELDLKLVWQNRQIYIDENADIFPDIPDIPDTVDDFEHSETLQHDFDIDFRISVEWNL